MIKSRDALIMVILLGRDTITKATLVKKACIWRFVAALIVLVYYHNANRAVCH